MIFLQKTKEFKKYVEKLRKVFAIQISSVDIFIYSSLLKGKMTDV